MLVLSTHPQVKIAANHNALYVLTHKAVIVSPVAITIVIACNLNMLLRPSLSTS